MKQDEEKHLVIELSNISKDYISDEIVTHVLHNVSLQVWKGEFIAIIGPSGSGKSTLLNIIGLLDVATGGTYQLSSQNVTNLTEDELARVRNKEIGFVFQQFNLLKRMTVLDNVILPSIYSGISSTLRVKNAKELLIRLGLEEQMHKKPNQLSGGQQQRVAIARALMNSPSLILADEPTGNLDSKSGEEVMKILKELNAQGNTIIMITHEKDIADQAQRVIYIKDGKVQNP
ncbi:MAG: ABC transporter ATP-binding protein [Candidatus Levybacteria bacterium]|nr:ABC transporter ATP-binding protein [Candidatus Levybacteria bacterium]